MSKFNLIKKFLPHKETQVSNIKFSLNDNKIDITMDINPNEKNIGENFGRLLAAINCGTLKKNIGALLLELSIKKPAYRHIVDSIMETWFEILSEETNSVNDNKPYIKPSQVFKQ